MKYSPLFKVPLNRREMWSIFFPVLLPQGFRVTHSSLILTTVFLYEDQDGSQALQLYQISCIMFKAIENFIIPFFIRMKSCIYPSLAKALGSSLNILLSGLFSLCYYLRSFCLHLHSLCAKLYTDSCMSLNAWFQGFLAWFELFKCLVIHLPSVSLIYT